MNYIGPFLKRFIGKHWILYCAGPVAMILAYQILKGLLPWQYAGNIGKPNALHWESVVILAVALAGTLIISWWHERIGRLLPWLMACIVLLSSIGVWLQKDKGLKWIGNDVPTENYRAALLGLELGPRELIATWNARANPRVKPNYMPNPDEVLDRITRLKLNWIVGSRWNRLDLPQDNNRMHMHPPGYPLALSAWLGIFGRSRGSAQAFELFLKFCLVVTTIIWSWHYIPSKDSINRVAVALLFATIPILILCFEPHANEMSALLALVAFCLSYEANGTHRIMRHITSGILLAGAAYTNFFYGLLLLAILGSLSLSKLARRSGLVLALAGGAGLVVSGFMVLGYYPWLTFLTGSQVTHYYRLSHSTDWLSSILDYFYFGFPILILTVLAIFSLTRLRGKPSLPCMSAVLIALAVGILQAFGLTAGNRYLVGMVFLLLPILAPAVQSLDLTRRKMLIIPIANFTFLMAVLFL